MQKYIITCFKKKYFLFIFLNFTILFASAQAYFQQEVNYKIQVRLDDEKHELFADEIIEYKNNSPHDLSVIYMHIWPNAYKDNSTELAKQLLENGSTKFYYSKESERGYIDMLDFKVDTQPVKWELLKDTIDVCKIYLNEPLKSGGKINISTPFHVKIPSGEFSRLGHIGQSYQITQWYPKPAVYDKHGWNYMPYLNQGEFYSEFGSYDVQIIVPKNYVLGATGDMIDGDAELQWLNNKVEQTKQINNFNSSDMEFPASDKETKTLRFKQSNVHDFAWFCDKRYHVLKGEIETPHTHKKVTTWVMFTNSEAHLWKDAVKYVNDAVYYYSLWNGDYPYNHCTAVDGTISAGGGMEYPNITVVGKSGSAFQLDVVIAHEVGHNWFYGMLGSNERMHPWLDEGINSFNELRYVRTKYPDRKLAGDFNPGLVKMFDMDTYPRHTQYYYTYILDAAKNLDQPIDYPAYKYTELNYAGVVYSKTAVVFDYLMAYVGEDIMTKAMQKYFDQWHFKHPEPNDLRKILEEETGKNLSWFFDDLIFTTKKLDYKIQHVSKNASGSWDLKIKNCGDVKGPLIIMAVKDEKIKGEIVFDGFEGTQVVGFPVSEVDYFKIDYMQVSPEINRNNNKIKTHGLFKRVEPLKLQFLASIDNPDKTQIYFTPVAGWNNYNKWMLGMAFYSSVLPQKKFEYQLMPLYSYSTKDIAGYGRLAYNIFPKGKLFQRITFSVVGNRYAYANHPFNLNFNRIVPELFVEFKKKELRNPITVGLKYRNISVIKDAYKADYTFTPPVYDYDTLNFNFNDLSIFINKKHTITPYSVVINFQQTTRVIKSSLTANYTYNFKRKNKSFDLRFFMGTFIGTKPADAGPYRFRLSGWRGYQDYMYDNIYFGRSETGGILANQFTENDGAFKFYSPLGQSSQFVAALNLKSSLGNLKLPLRVYADIGTAGTDGLLNETILYDAGLCLSFRKNMFEIYFPLLISKDFENYKKANGIKYPETIRFTLNLNMVNPFELIRNFEL